MRRKPEISPRRKQVIRTLLSRNLSHREVQSECKLVYKFHASIGYINKVSRGPILVSTQNKRRNSGRHKKLSERNRRQLCRFVRENEKLPTSMIAKLYAEFSGVRLSKETVRAELFSGGMRRVRPKHKPELKPPHIAARKHFAELYITWNIQWDCIVFSDEKKFNVYGNDGSVRLWPREAEIGTEAQNLPSKCYPESVTVWASFSSRGLGKLYIVPDGVRQNAYKYTEILKECLIPTIRKQFGGNKRIVTFQQDNASCHKAQKVQKWLADNHIETLWWPPQSCDMNPIENLWGIIVAKLRYKSFANRKELEQCILDVWNHEIPDAVLTELTTSMPKRVAEMNKNKGGHTHY